MTQPTQDEIKLSVFSKIEKELKKVGIKVCDSYISSDRDYGYIKGIPEESNKKIDIAVEVFHNPDSSPHKIAFNLKDRDYEIDPNKDLGLQQDFYIIARQTKNKHNFYVYSKKEMNDIIEKATLQNIVKSQLSKTANLQSIYNLDLDNFTKSEYENKWSKNDWEVIGLLQYEKE
jgi:hypothetical protein